MFQTKIHYFISGSVGVGKSSAIQTFMLKYGTSRIKTCFIKEYIDFDCFGSTKLNDYVSHKMSLIDFQLYILDCFRKQLDTEEYRNAKFVLWERHPREAQKVFATTLSISDQRIFEEAISNLETEFDIPPIVDTLKYRALKLSTYHLSSETIADIIYDEMKSNIASRMWDATFIFLYIPKQFVEEQFKRICVRGRPMEIDSYKNLKNLSELNRKYYNFCNEYLSGPFITGNEL